MKATVAHINAASGRRVVLVVNIAVTPGTATGTAEALEGCKNLISDGVTLVLAEIVRVGQRLLARDAAPAAERPALGGLVRHVLSDLATVAHRDFLAGVVSVATEPAEWRGIAEDFAAASRNPNEHPDNARDLDFCHRAACAMAEGDEQRAAQELAAMAGIDFDSWREAIEEEIAEDGARGAS